MNSWYNMFLRYVANSRTTSRAITAAQSTNFQFTPQPTLVPIYQPQKDGRLGEPRACSALPPARAWRTKLAYLDCECDTLSATLYTLPCHLLQWKPFLIARAASCGTLGQESKLDCILLYTDLYSRKLYYLTQYLLCNYILELMLSNIIKIPTEP